MSTKFGVYCEEINEHIPVASRSNGIRWLNDLARMLPDETPVTALDNSPQGIYDIRDIKTAMNPEYSKEKDYD